jgi:hypothetical protein
MFPPLPALSAECEQELNYMRYKTHSKRTNRLIPKNYAEFWKVAKKAGVYNKKKISTVLAEEYSLKTPAKSVSWIRENGKCLDNMVAKKSTIAGAGRGGFARRSISKGEMVVPVPLVHITDRTVLSTATMMDSGDDDEGAESSTKEKEQLLVNYCFGHGESSLLLCPMTNAALVNHCGKKIECGPNGPNAIYQWASPGWDANTARYLEKTIEDLAEVSTHFKSCRDAYLAASRISYILLLIRLLECLILFITFSCPPVSR